MQAMFSDLIVWSLVLIDFSFLLFMSIITLSSLFHEMTAFLINSTPPIAAVVWITYYGFGVVELIILIYMWIYIQLFSVLA